MPKRKTKRTPNPIGRRLPRPKWGRKRWFDRRIEGRRRKRNGLALKSCVALADELIRWGYDVTLEQTEDHAPYLTVSEPGPLYHRALATMRVYPSAPADRDWGESEAAVCPQGAACLMDPWYLNEWLGALTMMGRRVRRAFQDTWKKAKRSA